MAKVSIDYRICRGHQMCVLGLPDVFAVGPDDEGRAMVILGRQPDERLAALRDAAASCPENAIRIE
ncbi:ferredoxin [Sphingomonas oryzagri]